MCFVYILKSQLRNRYYIGSTSDIGKRLKEHNLGLVRSTKYYCPWELFVLEEYETVEQARKRENQIKSYKGGEAFKRLVQIKK